MSSNIFKAYTGEKHKDYPGFTVLPFYHKLEKMPWGAASIVPTDKIEKFIFLAGTTGRDPETDRVVKSREQEKAGAGKVVGGIKEQTIAAWTRIKEILEASGARLEDIVFVHKYLVNRDDWWAYREAEQQFFAENCPDLIENRRPGTLLKGVGLDLPDMLVEIEVIAAVAKKS